ncbi:putative H(+)-transporting two-sector ATPase [Helianthus annuus]|nr:putative H(+)-transporting two-sector ATPase [Helianthus annuus]KAJ0618813.1 putative H(+)-transporting two-sector ATPase [Helianthus annuus]KAJ0777268.1 putative H(+)-transporting two-sector ATPase [Helianthus annuus]KAJ0805445.1 putative H(+)-transporting two-sector ATPase [Helianthus annuus]
MAAAVVAATTTLQKSPATFHSRSPQTHSTNPPNLSFSGLKLPNLTIKLKTRSRRSGSCSGAKMTDSAAGRYATALADLANSNGTLDATATDLEKLNKLFSDESVLNFFISPIVSLENKRELIDDITSSGVLQLHVCNFLNILIESKRVNLIKEIVQEFEIVYNRLTETEMAIVTSVVKLEKQHLAQIAKQVQRLTGARNVRIKTAIDESLVAGFTIRYGNGLSKLIDMSVKKQLDDIAAEFEIGDIVIPGLRCFYG